MRFLKVYSTLALAVFALATAPKPSLVPKGECTEQATCVSDLTTFISRYDGLTEMEITATGALPLAYRGEQDGRVSIEEFTEPLLRARFPDHDNCSKPTGTTRECNNYRYRKRHLLELHDQFDLNNDGFIDSKDDSQNNPRYPDAEGDNKITSEDRWGSAFML
jgi:hypothetical protein